MPINRDRLIRLVVDDLADYYGQSTRIRSQINFPEILIIISTLHAVIDEMYCYEGPYTPDFLADLLLDDTYDRVDARMIGYRVEYFLRRAVDTIRTSILCAVINKDKVIWVWKTNRNDHS